VSTLDAAGQRMSTAAGVSGGRCSFTSTAISNGRFVVADKNGDGIPLHINGESVLVLSVDIRCHWDSRETYLAVEQSSFKVFAGSQSSEPLLGAPAKNPTDRITLSPGACAFSP
jgi:hypothetical protein